MTIPAHVTDSSSFLIAVRVYEGETLQAGRFVWQIGYFAEEDGTSVHQARSLTSDQYRAASEAMQYLRDVPAALRVDCDEVGVRVSRL